MSPEVTATLIGAAITLSSALISWAIYLGYRAGRIFSAVVVQLNTHGRAIAHHDKRLRTLERRTRSGDITVN